MFKPTLPREVADAIEQLRTDGVTNKGIVDIATVELKDPLAITLKKYADDGNFDKLIAALINGYGVKDERSVVELYRESLRKANEAHYTSPDRLYYNGKHRGIFKTLELLGINLEGVTQYDAI